MLNLLTQTIAVFLFQICFCLFILNKEIVEKISSVEYEVPNLSIAIARFIAGIAMHVNTSFEITSGMNKMKFAINHKWKFTRWRYAYMAGLL